MKKNTKTAFYFDVPGGCLSGGQVAKFYPISLRDCAYAQDAFANYEETLNPMRDEKVVDVVHTDQHGNHLEESDGYIPNFREQSGFNLNADGTVFQNNPIWFGQSNLTPADRGDIEKLCILEQVKLSFKQADRYDKAATDTAVYQKKQELDLETADIKENMPHFVIEGQDGFPYYISPSTNKSTKISEDRFLKAELIECDIGEPIIHISSENAGRHECYLSMREFCDDDVFIEKLEMAGIYIKTTRRNKGELIHELKTFFASQFESNTRRISHHFGWNFLPDGKVIFVAYEEESVDSIINHASESSKLPRREIWDFLKTDPFNYLKLLILLGLNSVAYLLTELIGTPSKSLFLLVTEGQKQNALGLFRGAGQISEHMTTAEIGKILTSTYSGFAIYIFKGRSNSSRKIINTISDIVQDGTWNGRPITTIPVIISETALPDDVVCDRFTVVVNDDLSSVQIGDFFLSNREMNDLIKEYPSICESDKMNSPYGYLLFAGEYVARTLKSDRCTSEHMKKLVSDLVDSDENEEGLTGDSEEFLKALFTYVLSGIAAYDKDLVPIEYSLDSDLLYDEQYVYLHKSCFDKVLSGLESDVGFDAIKSALKDDGILIPYPSSTYTAKCTYKLEGNDITKVVYRLSRPMLYSNSLRKPDLIKYYNIHGGGQNHDS